MKRVGLLILVLLGCSAPHRVHPDVRARILERARNLANALTPGYQSGPGKGFIRYTGRELDVAIQGDAFFVVRKLGTKDPVCYTRAGNFLIDAQGRLITPDGGYEVLDNRSLEPITMLDSLPPTFVIDPNGTIWQAGIEPIGTLAVRGDQDYRVLQGFLEESNVDVELEAFHLRRLIRRLKN